MNAQEAIAQADRNGWVEIRSGIYLNSAESIRADQEGWDEGDQSKNMDFSGPGYWITTDDGQTPLWISSARDRDLIELLSCEEEDE